MKRYLFFVVLFMGLSSVSLYSQMCEGEDCGCGMMDQGKGLMKKMKADLKLSDEQFDKIMEYKQSMRKDRKEIRKEKFSVMGKIREELEKEKTDDKELNKLVDKLVDLEKKKIKLRIEHLLDIKKKVLTLEQFKMLNAKMKEHRKCMMHGKKGKWKKGGKFMKRGM